MSQASYVEYYEQFLARPENQALREELESATSREGFNEVALAQGAANGFDFDLEDINLVMYASERKAMEAAGELSDEQLALVTGGMAAFSSSPSGINLGSIQTVGLSPSIPKINLGSASDTVMCCW
jgi:Nif11 domain